MAASKWLIANRSIFSRPYDLTLHWWLQQFKVGTIGQHNHYKSVEKQKLKLVLNWTGYLRHNVWKKITDLYIIYFIIWILITIHTAVFHIVFLGILCIIYQIEVKMSLCAKIFYWKSRCESNFLENKIQNIRDEYKYVNSMH